VVWVARSLVCVVVLGAIAESVFPWGVDTADISLVRFAKSIFVIKLSKTVKPFSGWYRLYTLDVGCVQGLICIGWEEDDWSWR